MGIATCSQPSLNLSVSRRDGGWRLYEPIGAMESKAVTIGLTTDWPSRVVDGGTTTVVPTRGQTVPPLLTSRVGSLC